MAQIDINLKKFLAVAAGTNPKGSGSTQFVLIEPKWYVATDAYIMTIAKQETANIPSERHFIKVSENALKVLTEKATRATNPWTMVKFDTGMQTFHFPGDAENPALRMSGSAALLMGGYPDWRRVVRFDQHDGPHGSYAVNPSLMKRLDRWSDVLLTRNVGTNNTLLVTPLKNTLEVFAFVAPVKVERDEADRAFDTVQALWNGVEAEAPAAV